MASSHEVQIQQLINRFEQIPTSKQAVEVFTKQLQEQLTKAFSDNTSTRLFTQNEQGLSSKDQLLSLLKPDSTLQMAEQLLKGFVKVTSESAQPQLQSALTQAEAQVQSSVDSRAMEQAIKTVLKGLGVCAS